MIEQSKKGKNEQNMKIWGKLKKGGNDMKKNGKNSRWWVTEKNVKHTYHDLGVHNENECIFLIV